MDNVFVDGIWKGKGAKFIIGKLTFGDVQEILDKAVSVDSDGRVNIKLGTLNLMLIFKGVKYIETEDGKRIKWSLNDVKELDPELANKILEKVGEVNDLNTLFQFGGTNNREGAS